MTMANIAIEHGEKMNASGFKHGSYMALSDLTHKIILNNYTDVSEVLDAIIEMQIKIKLGETMTSEQYEADAKADHKTTSEFF